ncbi:MAG: hypothetical protein IT355_06670 [Gemmatimonadaceae bacterium]|nr:hypothetical protein [Gemmatimonadaceae bacterium]
MRPASSGTRVARLVRWLVRVATRRHRVALMAAVAGCVDAAAPVTPVTPDPGGLNLSGVNIVPTAQFAVSPRWPAVGDTVTLDARYSHDNDGQVTAYRWVISNGIANTSGQVTRLVFRTAGTHTVTLTTYDDTGDSTSTTLSLPVGPGGAPAGAVDATQSHLTLSAPTTTGGTAVTATVTAKTSAGAVISGASVAIAASGLRVTASPISGTTNGSGVWTASLSAGHAQSVVVRAVAEFTALVDTVPLTISAATANVSSVRLSQATLTSASDSALLEVTVTDTAGNPRPGVSVAASGSPGGLSVTNAGTTDANGRRVMVVRSTGCSGAHTITITVGGAALGATLSLTPAMLSAYSICGPTLWLDASDASTFTMESSTRITQWRDKSGNALHASAPTGTSARPHYAATVFNGRPAAVFTGGINSTPTPEHLSLAGFPAQGLAAVSYFVVYKRTASSNCDRLFDFGSSTTVHVFFTVDCGGFQRYTQTTSGGAGEVSSSVASAALGTGQMLSIIHSGTASVRLNGAGVATSAAIPAPSAIGTPTNRWLGRSQYAADGYLSGQIAEVVVFPRALNNLEYAAVEMALMRKWGLGVLSVTQGAGQSAPAGTSPTSGLGFKVADASGNGISGATLVLQVTTGGGRLNGGTTLTLTTDSNGNASVPAGTWVLDYGTNVITAWYSSTAGQGQSIAITGTGTLPANLVMQYDAGNAGSLYRASSCTGTLAAVGDSVGCWKDLTGNVRHVTQPTAAARPTVSTFGSTGRTTLQFVLGRENYLESSATGLSAIASGARTIVAAARGNGSEDAGTNAGGAIVVFPGYHVGLHFYDHPTATLVSGEQWRDDGTLLWSEAPYTANAGVVATQVVSTSAGVISNTVRANSVTSGTTSLAGTAMAYPNLMRIGQGNVAPTTDYRWRLDGQVAEVMVFSRALSNTERQQVERYMGWKWGITVP